MDEIKRLELENRILRVQINEIYEFALETRNSNVQLIEEIDKLHKIRKIRLFVIFRKILKGLKIIIYEK
jgi:hypothetical protein